MSTKVDADRVLDASANQDSGDDPRGMKDGAFPSYSDAELDQLFSDIRRLDEDGYIGAAHSAAVKD